MPDLNKMAALKAAKYKIPITCGLCKYSRLSPKQDWGTCKITPYDHLKHTGPEREASIHRTGTCPKAKASLLAVALLGAHATFLEEQDG